MHFLTPVDVADADLARKRVHIQTRILRHFNLEIGFDDVIVVPVPRVVPLVRFDADLRTIHLNVEVDILQPLTRGSADRVNRHVAAVAAGNHNLAGEVIEPQLTSRAHRVGAVDRFGFALLGSNGRHGGQDQAECDRDCGKAHQFHVVSPCWCLRRRWGPPR
jgi:hypothetical protein